MTDISPQLAKIISLNKHQLDLSFLLTIVDSKKINNTASLIMIRTVRNHHALWEKHLREKDDTLAADNIKLQAILSGGCPVDDFDSGKIYLVTKQKDTTTGEEKASVVCRSDDYPYVCSMQATLVRSYLEKAQKTEQTVLREWEQGAIIRVYTIEVEDEPVEGAGGEPIEGAPRGLPTSRKMTFYASRSKIDCADSKWVNEKDCPKTRQAFQKACVTHGIRETDLQTPGTCHVFLFRHPFNQITNLTVPADGVIVHIRSYQFDTTVGTYEPLAFEIEGAKKVRDLTIDEAQEVILKGGVVMTRDPFRNTKYMLSDTSKLFKWMESDPARMYMQLRGQDPVDLAFFMKHLQPWAIQKIETTRQSLEHNKAAAAVYLHSLFLIYRRRGEHPAFKKRIITDAIKHLTQRYREAKDAAIAAGTFDPNPKPKGGARKGAKQYKPVFFLGTNQEHTKSKEIEILTEYLETLMRTNGATLVTLVKTCANLAKQEAHLVSKAAKKLNAAEDEVVGPIFVPMQIDCEDLDE